MTAYSNNTTCSCNISASHYDVHVPNLMPTQNTMDIWLVVNTCQLSGACILFTLLLCSLIMQNQLRSGAGFLVFHQVITEGQMASIHYFVYILTSYQYNLNTHTFYLSDEFCRQYYLYYMVNTAAGQLGIFNLAVNRYVALFHPLQYKRFVTKKALALAIVMCWVFGIACHIYFYMGGAGGFVATPPFGNCGFAGQGLAFKISTIASTYCPLGAAAGVYIVLFVKMAISHKSGNNHLIGSVTDSRAAKRLARRYMLTKILFVSSLLYCACFALIPILQGFFPKLYFANPMTRLWIRMVFFTGYILTPIVFFVMNVEYRLGVVKLFRFISFQKTTSNQIDNDPDRDPPFPNNSKSTKSTHSGGSDRLHALHVLKVPQT